MIFWGKSSLIFLGKVFFVNFWDEFSMIIMFVLIRVVPRAPCHRSDGSGLVVPIASRAEARHACDVLGTPLGVASRFEFGAFFGRAWPALWELPHDSISG